MMSESEKTLIGVLASHDDERKQRKLVELFNALVEKDENKEKLRNFAFVFTGGTFDRIVLGVGIKTEKKFEPIKKDVRDFLIHECGVIRLPKGSERGVTVLSNLIVQHKISIVWVFLSPNTVHWLNPENLALIRLCDQWRVKKLMNYGSVQEWFDSESGYDQRLNVQEWPIKEIYLRDYAPNRSDKIGPFIKTTSPCNVKNIYDYISDLEGNEREQDIEKAFKNCENLRFLKLPGKSEILSEYREKTEITERNKMLGDISIAIIAHDGMKEKMKQFAIDYENELVQFKEIITTGTTGNMVRNSSPILRDKVIQKHSGPIGGDIEIATEILYGYCQFVIFFKDPLDPHPHIDDIRVVEAVCLMVDDVRMFSNERHARDWIEHVIMRRM